MYIKQKKINKNQLRTNFMGSILIIFGILKLFNLNTFASIFQKYDIISKYVPIYSFIYPFIEIILGLCFLFKYKLNLVKNSTISLMIISIISVIISIIKGQNLRCGCLGSFFHIPLSYVTLSENIVMILMNIV